MDRPRVAVCRESVDRGIARPRRNRCGKKMDRHECMSYSSRSVSMLHLLPMRWSWILLLAGCLAAGAQTYDERIREAMSRVDQTVAAGPFQANWQSLEGYQVPDWYRDAKFGIFIHWGAYSVPAFESEWYPRNMYLKKEATFKHHVATFGPQNQFGYKDFIPRFTAEHFDARHWAEVFRKSGAKYVVPVAEHHDGFPMYD